MLKASDILYTSWEEIPLRKVKLILQLLPLIRWKVSDSASNTYLKNFLLKQLFRSKKIYLLTTPEQRVDLFTHEITWITQLSTTFPIRTYSFRGVIYHAPQPMMADITVERLMEADICLYRYSHTERSAYLDNFLSLLYTATKGSTPSGEVKWGIPDHEKIAIIRTFLGCWEKLRAQCPHLFPLSEEENPKSESPNPKSGDPANSWRKLLFELANTSGYPGLEAAKNAFAWEALPYMDHEQDKLIREMERLKKFHTKV